MSNKTLGHAALNGNTYELRADDDACRWYHNDEDIEVSGDDVADACEQLWLREGQPSDVDWYTPAEKPTGQGDDYTVALQIAGAL